VSYDGTVRALDLHAQCFVSKFEAPEGIEDVWFTDAWAWGAGVRVGTAAAANGEKKVSIGNHSRAKTPIQKNGHSFNSTGGGAENLLFVSRNDGYVSLIDFRMSSKPARGAASYAFTADMGYKVQSIQHYPTDENLILTSVGGAGGDISIYDLRVLGNKINQGTGTSGNATNSPSKCKSVVSFSGHTKSINAAYASPDGQYVVSVCQDNTIRCWSNIFGKTSGGDVGLEVKFSSRAHDNHTGRWLSTFRPTWDPKYDHTFISGSMLQPRRIEIFSVESEFRSADQEGDAGGGDRGLLSPPVVLRADALASVCSRNSAHPTMDIIAAGNSSGRVHIFR
jgi:WD repeat-containing protein 76